MATTDLPKRLRFAADTLEELSALAGYPHPAWPVWNAISLRREADELEKVVPSGT